MSNACELPTPQPLQFEHPAVGLRPGFVALLVSAGFFVFFFLTQALAAPYPRHGDCWTEMDCVTTARNFAAHGFEASCFNPTRDHGQDIGLPPVYVSDGRHPVGSYVVLGLLHRAGLSFAAARAVPLAVSALAIFVFFSLTRRVLNEWQTPFLAGIALAVEPAYYLLADSLYYFSYDFLLKTLCWLGVVLATAGGARRNRYLALAALAAFTQAALSSYEPLPSMGLFAVLFPMAFGTGTPRERARLGLRFGLFVGLGMVLALVTRFAHLAVLHGGLEAAVHNFRMAILARSVGVPGVEAPTPPWPGYLAEIAARLWFMYPVHAVIIAAGLGTVGLMRAPRPAVKLALLLTVVEGVYFLLMRQHAFQHLHTLYHLVFSTALWTAIAIGTLGGLAPTPLLRTAVPVALTAVLLLAAPALGPTRCGENLEREHDWSAWEAQSRAMAEHIPADGVVVLNTGNDPKYGFFLDRTYLLRQGWDYDNLARRPHWGVHELQSLDTKGRPLFVLVPRGDARFRDFDGAFRRVGVYDQAGVPLELFEVRPTGW